MRDRNTHSRLIIAALMLALAAVIAGPASARPTPSANGSSDVSDSTPTTVVPYLSHGIGVDKSQFTGTAAAPELVIPYLSHGIGVDESQFTGTNAAKAPELVIPYLSHGVGVDESRFAGAANETSTATAPRGDGWSEWGVSGVAAGGGIAALLLATLGTLAYRSRHGRTAMS